MESQARGRRRSLLQAKAGCRSTKISKRFCAKSNTASSPYHHIQHHGPAWRGRLARREVGWQNGNLFLSFPLDETDETKAMRALLLQHPFEEAARPSDREIDAKQKHFMSDHDKNLFIEQHKDGYAVLRGGVKDPLAVEPTQDAAIEKARKLVPDAAIHVERVRNVEGGGRDKWRRL
jgi:hypothetical protein